MTHLPDESSAAEPQEPLALAMQDAKYMVETSDSPRGFYPVLAAAVASIVTFKPVIGYPAGLLLLLLALPLGLWMWFATRARSKPRTILRFSGSYTGLSLLGLLFLQLLNFWDAESWWQIALKWLMTFLGLVWFFSRMQRVYQQDRLRDAREEHL